VTTYVNQYYEKTGTTITTNYYHGGKLVAVRQGTTLSFILQDHLGSTVGTVNTSGTLASTISYFSFGECRNSTGTLPTEQKFTGQRLDSTGLYYYGARYYDPSIGRFISADTIVPDPYNPQTLNRYSYCINNPLKYVDPTGHDLTVVQSGTNMYGETTYDVYDGDTWVGSGTGWEGVRTVYDVYCSINGLTDGCVVTYNYQSSNGTYPVYLILTASTMGNLLHNNGIGGISLNTGTFGEGIFITWDDIQRKDLNSQMKTFLDHESQHYFEQNIGFVPWTAAYYGEIGIKWAWYGGDYWQTTYNMNSFEMRARVASGASPYYSGSPSTTHWWDPAWNKCKQALKTVDHWMASPLQ
jgi:RHS repeat-associated protein